MKSPWLVLNNAYIFFGCSLYAGVLWALHFFWYPTWRVYTAANYYDHFIPPTQAATRFFTVVVPPMFFCLLVMVWTERKTAMRWVAWATLACLSAATYVGQMHIIPVNKILTQHITDQARVTELFQKWMQLNDIRWVIMTLAWLLMMYYFGAKAYRWDQRS